MKLHRMQGFWLVKGIPAVTILFMISFILQSCNKMSETPEGCVVSFIVGAERKNMARVWENLSPTAQAYYNSQGEKMRKSGKGALENEIAKIEKFKTVKTDYTIEPDKSNNSMVNINLKDGKVIKVETELSNGIYLIKNENSVKNILESIAASVKQTDGY